MTKSLDQPGDPQCGAPGSWTNGLSPWRKDGKPRKRNRYPDRCFCCGHLVPAGKGAVELSRGEWLVYCIEGETPRSTTTKINKED